MKNIRLIGLLLLFFAGLNAEYLEKHRVKAEIDGKTVQVDVLLTDTGTAIQLTRAGSSDIVTAGLGGEHLHPQIVEGKHRYYISWIQFVNKQLNLCWYDSETRNIVILNRVPFEYIGPVTPLYRLGRFRALIFCGKRQNEANDLYVYDPWEDRCKNITKDNTIETSVSLRKENMTYTAIVKSNRYRDHYRVNPRTLSFVRTRRTTIEKKRINTLIETGGYHNYNQMLAFGDSITNGKIRMEDLREPGQKWKDVPPFPELTYWGTLETYINEKHKKLNGKTEKNILEPTKNLGVNSESASDGRDRMIAEFEGLQAYFCFIMFGTNDVTGNSVPVKSTAGDLLWMWEKARNDFNMYPIAFTIPPQMNKKKGDQLQYYKFRTEQLNDMIRQNAETHGYPLVDCYKIFMEYDPPDGWKNLMEDYKGNHPSPVGHLLIRDALIPLIEKLPPKLPTEIQATAKEDGTLTLSWNPNIEFDFSEYHIEYGYYPNQLNRFEDLKKNGFSFYINQLNAEMSSTLYFRIYSSDWSENRGPLSKIYMFEFKTRE